MASLSSAAFQLFSFVSQASVEGREGIFNCVKLPIGSDPLLGLILLEDLGLEPDLQNQRLRLLPMEGKDTYLTVL